jgi:Family of unknown function (DUF6247)
MTAAAQEPWTSANRAPFADASPAQVRAALTPEDVAEFDRQWREVMARATDALDLTEVLATLDSWRRIAWLTSAHGHEGYRALLARAERARASGRVPADSVPWESVKAELGL